MPLRPRHGYAADLHRGLPASDTTPAKEFPTRTHGQVRAAIQPRSTGFELASLLRGFTPLVPHVHLLVSLAEPAPSGSTDTSRRCRSCSPPSPASPGSGCSLLHRPAATGRRWRSFTPTRFMAPRGARCRNDRISMSLSRSPPGSSRSNVNAFVMPRYASRSSMRRHHRVVIGDDRYGQRPRPDQGRRRAPRPARTPFSAGTGLWMALRIVPKSVSIKLALNATEPPGWGQRPVMVSEVWPPVRCRPAGSSPPAHGMRSRTPLRCRYGARSECAAASTGSPRR
jgi:hypothetical protein